MGKEIIPDFRRGQQLSAAELNRIVSEILIKNEASPISPPNYWYGRINSEGEVDYSDERYFVTRLGPPSSDQGDLLWWTSDANYANTKFTVTNLADYRGPFYPAGADYYAWESDTHELRENMNVIVFEVEDAQGRTQYVMNEFPKLRSGTALISDNWDDGTYQIVPVERSDISGDPQSGRWVQSKRVGLKHLKAEDINLRREGILGQRVRFWEQEKSHLDTNPWPPGRYLKVYIDIGETGFWAITCQSDGLGFGGTDLAWNQTGVLYSSDTTQTQGCFIDEVYRGHSYDAGRPYPSHTRDANNQYIKTPAVNLYYYQRLYGDANPFIPLGLGKMIFCFPSTNPYSLSQIEYAFCETPGMFPGIVSDQTDQHEVTFWWYGGT